MGCGLTTNKFKNRRRSCVDRLRLLTSREAFEPSRLDDEQPSEPTETTTAPPPPPHVHLDGTHVRNDTRPSLFFTALLHPCIIVNANRRTERTGRPGNEARAGVRKTALFDATDRNLAPPLMCQPDVTTCDQIFQAFPLCICTLQATNGGGNGLGMT